jgi:DNA primase
MRSEEGRARFLSQAKPLVSEVQAPALAAMLRRRLAELAGLGVDEIDRLVPGRTQERPSRPAPGVRTPKRNVPLESKLLARILLKPELAGMIPEDALKGGGSEAATLRTVVGYLRENPSTLGQASAYFAGTEHEAVIEEALAEPLLNQPEETEFDLEAEVQGIVEKLHADQQARRRSELMRLMVAGNATPAEQAEYAKLHEQLASSMTGNPTVESRSKH